MNKQALPLPMLCAAVELSYKAQRGEGMDSLRDLGQVAMKYCGSGHGGYALYLFRTPMDRRDASAVENLIHVEPYSR